MAEKQGMTMKSTESLSEHGKNGSPKAHRISSVISGLKGSLEKEIMFPNTKVNKDKNNDHTKEEKVSVADKMKDFPIANEIISKEGNLTVHCNKHFLKKSKQCFFRLLPASPSSRAHLQQYNKTDCSKKKGHQPEHVIFDHDVNCVASLNEPEHAFVIRYKDESLVLIAEDDVEKMTWIKALQKVLLSQHQITYTDINIPRSFHVYISKATQIRIGDGSLVELLVEYGSIAIIASNRILIARWPIAMLRKFGFDAQTFTVTAGRNAEHGEGNYTFLTDHGEEIHRTVKAAKRKESSLDNLSTTGVWPPGCIAEASSPSRPYHGPPPHSPFEKTYPDPQVGDPIYEPLYEENSISVRKRRPEGSLVSKKKYPTDPIISSRAVPPFPTSRSLPESSPQRIGVKSPPTPSIRQSVHYDDVRPPWATHSYNNIVTSETAFPIHPNKSVVKPPEKESAYDQEPLYAQVDQTKKINKNKHKVVSLVPEHKRVTLQQDAKGYTLVSHNKS